MTYVKKNASKTLFRLLATPLLFGSVFIAVTLHYETLLAAQFENEPGQQIALLNDPPLYQVPSPATDDLEERKNETRDDPGERPRHQVPPAVGDELDEHEDDKVATTTPPQHQFQTNCVQDIEDVFSEGVFATYRKSNGKLKEGPSRTFIFKIPDGERLPPDNDQVNLPASLLSHVESIVKIDGDGNGTWLVMGRASRNRAPFYVMQNTVGLESESTVRAYKKISKTHHIGGMQALGNMVAMAIECNEQDCSSDSIMFWDFSNPIEPNLIHELNLPDLKKKAHWVAVSHISDGRLLVMVNRGDDGVTDAFLSVEANQPLHANTQWSRLPRFTIDADRWNKGPGTYQNANFLRSCESGDLYLLGMRQRGRKWWSQWNKDNQVELFKVTSSINESDPVEFSFVTQARFKRFDNSCLMRAGSSVFVGDDFEPRVYCSDSDTRLGDLLVVTEFTALDE